MFSCIITTPPPGGGATATRQEISRIQLVHNTCQFSFQHNRCEFKK